MWKNYPTQYTSAVEIEFGYLPLVTKIWPRWQWGGRGKPDIINLVWIAGEKEGKKRKGERNPTSGETLWICQMLGMNRNNHSLNSIIIIKKN